MQFRIENCEHRDQHNESNVGLSYNTFCNHQAQKLNKYEQCVPIS